MFTVLTDDEFRLAPPIGNRSVYLRKVTPLNRVVELITPHVQSMGVEADQGSSSA